MKNRRKYGLLWGLLKVVCVIAIIWGILIGGNYVRGKAKEYKLAKELAGGFDIASAKEYKDTWKNTNSDIEGMTVWDKYKKGLAVSKNSDTDGDGLTDKDEIEKYKSDPLKVSTAGDLYTDSYKVSHNMDVNKRCEYEGDILFPYNECEEVSLCAELPTDLNAVVKRKSNDSEINGCKVYAAYEIYNYSGKVTINLNRISDQEDIEAGSVTVYVSDGDEIKKYDHSADGSNITLKKKFKPEYQYDLYVCEKTKVSLVGKIFGNALEVSENVAEEEITGAAIVSDAPLLTYFFKHPVNVIYEDLGDDAKNDVLKGKILSELTRDIISYEPDHYDKNHVRKGSVFEIKAQYELLQKIAPFFDMTHKSKEEIGFINLLYLYYSYEDRNEYLAEKQRRENGRKAKDEADIVKRFAAYELPFPNFRSQYGKTGNCAGITHLTAYLYNRLGYPENGYYTQNGYNISWDLTGDEENATLLNPGLQDYKTRTFVDDKAFHDNLIDDSKLTEGEAEFIKMIGSAYLCGNDVANELYQYSYGGINGNHIYDYALVEEMMRFLDSDKILDMYLKMNDGTGHTVNIYGYEKDESDPNVIWFNVYDPNFPQDDIGERKLSKTGFKLKVTKKIKAVGDGYTFSYDYAPILNSNYGATSNRTVNKTPMVLVLDENWNDINPVKVTQDITNEFTLMEDNNGFTHSSDSFFSSEEEHTHLIDDEYLERLTKYSDFAEKNLILENTKSKWNGSCYGIACTMGFLYDGEIGIFDLTDREVLDYYDIGKPVDDHKFRNEIEYYYLSQLLKTADDKTAVSYAYNESNIKKDELNEALLNCIRDSDDISVLLEKLVNHTKQSPVEFEYNFRSSGSGLEKILGKSQIHGHSILALGCHEKEDAYIVELYDMNKPDSKLEMTVAKDFRSFSFTDGIGNNITEENYVAIGFRNLETLYYFANHGSKSLKEKDTTIVFASDADFTIRNENGEEMSFSPEGFSGDLVVNSLNFISDGDEHATDIKIKTDNSSSYTIDSRGENLDITVASNEYFYSVSGQNIKSVAMHDGVVDVDGEQYDFDVALASNTVKSATDLVSYKGKSSGKIKVETAGEKVVINSDSNSDEGISDLVAYNYEKDKTYDRIKPRKNGEYSISAGTSTFMLKKYWWIGLIIIAALAASVIVFRKNNKGNA